MVDCRANVKLLGGAILFLDFVCPTPRTLRGALEDAKKRETEKKKFYLIFFLQIGTWSA